MKAKYWLNIVVGGLLFLGAYKALIEHNRLQKRNRDSEIEQSKIKRKSSKYQEENELLKEENQKYKDNLFNYNLVNKIGNPPNNQKEDTNNVSEKHPILEDLDYDISSFLLEGEKGNIKLKEILRYKKPKRKIKEEKPAYEETDKAFILRSKSTNKIWSGGELIYDSIKE